MPSNHVPWVLMATLLIPACGGGGGGGGGGGATSGGGSGDGTTGGPGLPLYVLVGGSAKPAASGIYLDGKLTAGELFILPRDALAASTTYTVAVAASTASGEQFNHSWSFTTAAGTVGPSQTTVLAELNAYRSTCGNLGSVAAAAAYITSATKHAGYQCETNTITHGETDTSQHFYVDNDFAKRISIANGGTASSNSWGSGITYVTEDIASNSGAAAVPTLWDSVYHRLPMMRRKTTIIGNGDRSDAAALAGSDVSTTGLGYQTIDFGGVNATAAMQSYWPHDGATGVFTSFNTDNEGPDPVSSANANGTPDHGMVGPPIHLILPTTENFTALSITVTQ